MAKPSILLIRANVLGFYRAVFPPFGAMFIASSLRRSGFEPVIFDAQVESPRRLRALLRERTPLWAGFTDVITGPAIRSNLEFAGFVRSVDPRIPLVWGGPHPSVMPEQTAGHGLVDIVCVGEGERTAVALSRALAEGGDLAGVPGIVFKRGGELVRTPEREPVEDWDSEVGLAWDLVDFEKYVVRVGGHRSIPIVTSRGCPFRCGFCVNPSVNGRRYRGWSQEKTISECGELLRRGIGYVTFLDDNMAAAKTKLLGVAAYLHGNRVKWAADNGFRADSLDEETLRTFQKTGCDHISFGAESGSQRMLDLIQKDIRAERLLETTRLLSRFGIGAKYSWMIGFPGEKEDDVLRTLDMIDAVNRIDGRAAHFIGLFAPYPGTALAETAVAAGWRPPDSLAGWAALREEQRPGYIQGLWGKRTIITSCYFSFSLRKGSRTFSSDLRFSWVLGWFELLGRWRWRRRFFAFPLEFLALSLARRVLEPLSSWRARLSWSLP